jgi:sulfotransferase
MSKTVYLTGCPRSGSTLLCSILNTHSEITATPSSPLCSIVQKMKHEWSDEPFLLSQLDSNFDAVYDRLKRSTKAFIDEWSRSDTKITVDKNRGWLFNVELIRHLYPDMKMIVCLRDLRGIYASVEKQHIKTALLDFPDHMEANLVDVRAANMFADQGIIGAPVKALYNLGDVPEIMDHLFIFRYEDLLQDKEKSLKALFEWLGVEPETIDFDNLNNCPQESDSYYRMKYPHVVKKGLVAPENYAISPRILETIPAKFEWFYKTYYPEATEAETKTSIEDDIAAEIEKELENE